MRLRTTLASCGLALLMASAGPVCADDEGAATDRVSFSVDASREVENDWARAVVGVTEEGPDAAELADRINQTMKWALAQAEAVPEVEQQSGAYHTSPVYEKNRVRRWRASQDLILESRDASRLSALIGTLQSRLLLRSIGFSVSDERRRAVEGELTQEVLGAFRERADVVRQSLGRRGYTLVTLNLQSAGSRPPVPVRQARGMAAATAEVAPPALEGGTTRLQISAFGTIQLE